MILKNKLYFKTLIKTDFYSTHAWQRIAEKNNHNAKIIKILFISKDNVFFSIFAYSQPRR